MSLRIMKEVLLHIKVLSLSVFPRYTCDPLVAYFSHARQFHKNPLDVYIYSIQLWSAFVVLWGL